MGSRTIGHWILAQEGVEKGYLRLEDDLVAEICSGEPPPDTPKAIVMPAFVNAHTHIGDSAAYPAPKGSVQEIVGAPDGYKHRALRTKSSEEKTAGMRVALEVMKASGTTLFGDFREEGLDGVRLLRNVLGKDFPKAVVFGRPAGTAPTESEVAALLAACDGFGISAISDLPIHIVETLAERAKRAGKLFSVHASEAEREDIDTILDLKPSFLIHMCKATIDDVQLCSEAGVPIVVCPRSNRFFGLNPDIPRLQKAGVTVCIGTDNAMIARPDILEELKAAYSTSKLRGGVSPLDIVKLATFNGRKVLNVEAKITTEIDERTDLVVVRVKGDDPLRGLVTEARSEDILAFTKDGKVGRTNAWTR